MEPVAAADIKQIIEEIPCVTEEKLFINKVRYFEKYIIYTHIWMSWMIYCKIN